MKKLISLCVLFSFIGCNTLHNHSGMSSNIIESKKRNVFIAAYKSISNPVYINDSLELFVKEAWMEKAWKYDDIFYGVTEIEGFQLIVILKEELHPGYGKNWLIGIDGNRHFRFCGSNCLISDFDSLNNKDLELWKVQAGWKLNADADKIIIGDFILKKIKD